MAIDINNFPASSAQVSELGTQRGGNPKQFEKAPDKSSGPTQVADQVSLTPTAQQLRHLEQQIANQPVVDTQKVSAVKEALANDSFEIYPMRIAEKLMGLERALGDMR